MTNNDVVINSMQNISMTAKEQVLIQAETAITLCAEGSSITIDPTMIKEKAADIYLNE